MEELSSPYLYSDIANQNVESFEITVELAAYLVALDIDDLKALTELYDDHISDSDADMFICCNYILFQRSHSVDCLQLAIDRAEEFVARAPPGHPDHTRRRAIWKDMNKAMLDEKKLEGSSDMDALQSMGFGHSVEGMKRIILVIQSRDGEELPFDPDRSQRADALAALYRMIFEETGNLEDLDYAIKAAEVSEVATPLDNLDKKGNGLFSLRILLMDRYKLTNQMADLDQAIDIMEKAAEITHVGGDMNSCFYCDLAELLYTRFNITAVSEDLDLAIQFCKQGLKAKISNDVLVGLVRKLVDSSLERYNLDKSIEDLNRSIELIETALVALAPDNTPVPKPVLLLYLVLESCLALRQEHAPKLENINRIIEVINMELKMDRDPMRPRWNMLNGLGYWYFEKFLVTSAIEDIDCSADAMNKAIAEDPGEISNDAACLSDLATILIHKFEQTRNMDDLNLASEMSEKALKVMAPNDPRKHSVLIPMSGAFGLRFEDAGEEQDLKRAIELIIEAIESSPPKSYERAVCLTNYATFLLKQYYVTRSLNDLNNAAEMAQLAIDMSPPGSDKRGIFHANVGIVQSQKFQRTSSLVAAIASVDNLKQALAIIHPNDPDRVRLLLTFTTVLTQQFSLTSQTENLDEAIQINEEALRIMPKNHRLRYVGLMFLARTYIRLFDHTKHHNYLDSSIKSNQMALEEIDPLHHRLARICVSLGSQLMQRGRIGDNDQALEVLRKGWSSANSELSFRIHCAVGASTILSSRSKWAEASSMLEEAVSYLPIVSPRSLESDDQQHVLTEFSGLACQSAAVALEAGRTPYEVLRSLEVGRGVIAGLLLEMRSDISDLKRAHPELAQKFLFLRDMLDSPISDELNAPLSQGSTPVWKAEPKGGREIDKQFAQVLAKVRALPEFESFLLPPSAEELMTAASLGPIIVINVSTRCDALLIERHQIRSLRLNNLHQAEIVEKVESMKKFGITFLILQWLWDVAASPILQELGFHTAPASEDWPRVCWILTGALSHLPMHAAGYHASGSTETVIDRVMSSYSSSIKALMHGRRNAHRGAQPKPRTEDDSQMVKNDQIALSNRALLVSMSNTSDVTTNLPYAETEVEIVKSLCSSMNLEPIQPSRRRKEVLDEMNSCKIFHFAGHGQSFRSDPSRSCLLLEDWQTSPLTVADLRSSRFQENPPFLGYLSACSTSVNDMDDLLDEGIHLVSAFHLAGFRHVIGTLWEVSDLHCVNVAKVFYETIRDCGMEDEAVCKGLHRAVRELRDGYQKKAHQSDQTDARKKANSTIEAAEIKAQGDCDKDGGVIYNSEGNRGKVKPVLDAPQRE